MVQDEAGPADAETVAKKLAAEFFEALELLYVRVGEPPLRTVAARSPRLSASNVGELVSGKRKGLPGQEVITELVKALLHTAPPDVVKPVVKEWEERRAHARLAQRAAERAAAEQHRTATAAAEDITATAERVLDEARAEADSLVAEARAQAANLVSQARSAAERELYESQSKEALARVHRAAELEAEWHTEVGNRQQALDRELTEKRQQAEAQLNEMAERAEKTRADTEAHRDRIIEAARGEVEDSRDRIAGETAQAIEHVRMETENMRTAARAELESQNEALAQVGRTVAEARNELEELKAQTQAQVEAQSQAQAAAAKARQELEILRAIRKSEAERFSEAARRSPQMSALIQRLQQILPGLEVEAFHAPAPGQAENPPGGPFSQAQIRGFFAQGTIVPRGSGVANVTDAEPPRSLIAPAQQEPHPDVPYDQRTYDFVADPTNPSYPTGSSFGDQ
jgi:hypothetical protein